MANHGQGCHYCRKVSALPKVQLCTFCTFVGLNLSSINAQCPIIFIQSASTNMSCDHQKSPLYQTKDFSRLLIWFLRLTRAELCPKSVPQIVDFEFKFEEEKNQQHSSTHSSHYICINIGCSLKGSLDRFLFQSVL